MSSSRPSSSAPCSAAVAGMVGGSVATLVLHPLELLKTRQAVYGQDGRRAVQQRYAKMHRAVLDIVRNEGGLRGLYAGVGANVLVASSSWGIYFLAYGALKCEGGFGHQISAAFGAGAITTLVSNPLSVVRTRMVLSQRIDKTNKYNSVLNTFHTIIKGEGLKGLYKGLGPNLLNVSHGAIQIVIYEHIKKRLSQGAHNNHKLTFEETLTACCLSKLLASLVTYPCQAVRACQQASQSSSSVMNFRTMIKTGGFLSLYRGLPAYLLHVVPNVCLVFAAYEAIAN